MRRGERWVRNRHVRFFLYFSFCSSVFLFSFSFYFSSFFCPLLFVPFFGFFFLFFTFLPKKEDKEQERSFLSFQKPFFFFCFSFFLFFYTHLISSIVIVKLPRLEKIESKRKLVCQTQKKKNN